MAGITSIDVATSHSDNICKTYPVTQIAIPLLKAVGVIDYYLQLVSPVDIVQAALKKLLFSSLDLKNITQYSWQILKERPITQIATDIIAKLVSSFRGLPLSISSELFLSISQLHERENHIQIASLEKAFLSFFQEDLNTHQKVFTDFLEPNEKFPLNMLPHINRITKRGLYVVTGGPRAFFTLLFSNPSLCDGLVVRDINPRIKAYVDFNTMLLRISEDVVEYAALSKSLSKNFPEFDFEERIKLIRLKLQKDNDIPEQVKAYYTKHLEGFAKIYFDQSHDWKISPDFEEVAYHKHEALFAKLQKFAKEGKIIATVGDINDLEFLEGYNVSLVDTSNISDYTLIDLKGGKNFNPLIMYTVLEKLLNEQSQNKGPVYLTNYYSFRHKPLSEEKRKELTELLDQLEALNLIDDKQGHPKRGIKTLCSRVADEIVCPGYNENTLRHLQEYKRKFLIA